MLEQGPMVLLNENLVGAIGANAFDSEQGQLNQGFMDTQNSKISYDILKLKK